MQIDSKVPVITLDGPSGTGKGTICYQLARYLRWNILDSGCLYRALAYLARKKGLDFKDLSEIIKLGQSLDLGFDLTAENICQVILQDIDISELIRSEECGQDASKIATIPEIRQALLESQRAYAKLPGLITDGRDMGTVVFPNAILKFYLDASAEKRAQRRYYQLKEKGIDVNFAMILDELVVRDSRDKSRLHAPLVPAQNAVVIDTTELTVMQVFDCVLQHVIGEV